MDKSIAIRYEVAIPVAKACRVGGVEEDQIVKILRDWLSEMVDEYSDGNHTRFGKLTGIKQSDVSNVLGGKKGRTLTWLMISRISETKGMPSAQEIFATIAKRIAEAEVDRITGAPQLQRDRLKQRLASGEIRERTARATEAARPGARPARPESPLSDSSSKPAPKG